MPRLSDGTVGSNRNLCPTVHCSNAATGVDAWLCGGQCSPQHPCLFDVVSDPEERNNLVAALPAVVARLDAILRNLRAAVVPPYRPVPNTNGSMCRAFKERWDGYFGPWYDS